MSDWKETIDTIDRINDKLDLILELVHARNSKDWKQVDEVCKKLDDLKKVKVIG